MVWATISPKGRSPLIFIDSDIKINKEVYIREILEGALIPWTNFLYLNGNWTFQQDGAMFHTANMTQQWCENYYPWFLTKKEWAPSLLDLNVLNFCVWSFLEREACATPATSVKVLKK